MDAGKRAVETQKIYQIRVQGRLDASWSDWFDGMRLTSEDGNDRSPVTTITGAVVDQAALHGLLARISDLNLTLISVTRVECTRNNNPFQEREGEK
jgi:hypothetical protein